MTLLSHMCSFLAATAILTLAPSSASSNVGDCGVPSSGGDAVTATDGLFILQVANGQQTCSLCQCDVDRDGAIDTSDALLVQNVVIQRQGFYLRCPACSGTCPAGMRAFNAHPATPDDARPLSGSTTFCGLPCNQGDMTTVLANNCASGAGRLTFDCTGSQSGPLDIKVSEDVWQAIAIRPCSNITISGQGRDIGFVLGHPAADGPIGCSHRCVGFCATHPERRCTRNDECNAELCQKCTNPSGTCLRHCSGNTQLACTATDLGAGGQSANDGDCRTYDPTTGNVTANYGNCVCNTASECAAIGVTPINNHNDCTQCPLGTPCMTNPEVEGGKPLFRLAGTKAFIHDVSVNEFFEGIVAEGLDLTVDDVTFDGNCDDGFTNGDAAAGTILRNSLFLNAPDKALTENGDVDVLSTDPQNRRYYNSQYDNVDWIDCATPIRVQDPTRTGRYKLVNSTMQGTAFGTGANSTYTCSGPKFSGAAYLFSDRTTVTRCVEGLFLGGRMESRVQNGVFSSNQKRGITTTVGAKSVISNSTIQDNGKRPSGVVAGLSPDGNGGVSRRGNTSPQAQLDLGGGNVTFTKGQAPGVGPGHNDLCPNTHPNSSNSIGVDNLNGAVQARADNNCWCAGVSAGNQKLGSVTVAGALTDGNPVCGPQEE